MNRSVKLLEQNNWQSSLTLANMLGATSAMVRRRLKRLIQKGLLRAESGLSFIYWKGVHQFLREKLPTIEGIRDSETFFASRWRKGRSLVSQYHILGFVQSKENARKSGLLGHFASYCLAEPGVYG